MVNHTPRVSRYDSRVSGNGCQLVIDLSQEVRISSRDTCWLGESTLQTQFIGLHPIVLYTTSQIHPELRAARHVATCFTLGKSVLVAMKTHGTRSDTTESMVSCRQGETLSEQDTMLECKT